MSTHHDIFHCGGWTLVVAVNGNNSFWSTTTLLSTNNNEYMSSYTSIFSILRRTMNFNNIFFSWTDTAPKKAIFKSSIIVSSLINSNNIELLRNTNFNILPISSCQGNGIYNQDILYLKKIPTSSRIDRHDIFSSYQADNWNQAGFFEYNGSYSTNTAEAGCNSIATKDLKIFLK